MRRLDGQLYRIKPMMICFEGDADLDDELSSLDAAAESGDYNDYFDTYGGDVDEPVISDDDSGSSEDLLSRGYDPYTGLDSDAMHSALNDSNSSWYDGQLSDMSQQDLKDYVNLAYGGEGSIDRTLNYDYDPSNLDSRNDKAGQSSRLNRVNDAAEAFYFANGKTYNGKGTTTERAQQLLANRDKLNQVYNAGKAIVNMRTQDPHLTGNKQGAFIGFDGKRGNTLTNNAVSNKSLSDRYDQWAREQLGGKSGAWSIIDSLNPAAPVYQANDLALSLMGKGVPQNQARQLAEDWMDKEGVGKVASNTINALLAANSVKDVAKGVFQIANARNVGNIAAQEAHRQGREQIASQLAAAKTADERCAILGSLNKATLNVLDKVTQQEIIDALKNGTGLVPSLVSGAATAYANSKSSVPTQKTTFTDVNGKSKTTTTDQYANKVEDKPQSSSIGLGSRAETTGKDITFNPQSTWDGSFKADNGLFNPITGDYTPSSTPSGNGSDKSSGNGSDTFSGDDSASVDTPSYNIPTSSGYNNNAVVEQANKQQEINKSNGRIGLSEDPNRTNYDVDDWNRGMTNQSSELVSDKDCKTFILASVKHEPAIANWMDRVASYYRH